jgi:glycosyltransferase involved in cell wall biosynthesis
VTDVLYVHHRPELGGAAGALARLIEGLDRDRFRPHVYTPPGPAARQFAEVGATVHAGPAAAFTHVWSATYRGVRWMLLSREAARLPGHLFRLRSLLLEDCFGLVHLNDSPLLPAADLARRHGLPIVWHLRSALPNGGLDRRSRAIQHRIAAAAAASIAINEDVAAAFQDVGPEVVFDPVDLDRFRPADAAAARARLGIADARPVVGFLGYLYPAKGFRQLIRAAGRLRTARIDATFLVAGGGVLPSAYFRRPQGRALELAGAYHDYEGEARRLAADLGVAHRIRFLPFTPDPADVYRASDVVAIPSQGPELGLPALEAAACGVPVVATGSRTCAGVVVPDETGLLARDGSPEALADALAELIVDPARRRALGDAARGHAERHFSAETSARKVESIYERVLSG